MAATAPNSQAGAPAGHVVVRVGRVEVPTTYSDLLEDEAKAMALIEEQTTGKPQVRTVHMLATCQVGLTYFSGWSET